MSAIPLSYDDGSFLPNHLNSVKSLPTLLQDTFQVINTILSNDCQVTRNSHLIGLIHAAWMRLSNWDSDIKKDRISILWTLDVIAPQTAAIVQGRLETLLRTARLVKDNSSSSAARSSEECRELAEQMFRAAADVSRTTRTLRRLACTDHGSVEMRLRADYDHVEAGTDREAMIENKIGRKVLVDSPDPFPGGSPPPGRRRRRQQRRSRSPPNLDESRTSASSNIDDPSRQGEAAFKIGDHVQKPVIRVGEYCKVEYVITSVEQFLNRWYYQLAESNGPANIIETWHVEDDLQAVHQNSAEGIVSTQDYITPESSSQPHESAMSTQVQVDTSANQSKRTVDRKRHSSAFPPSGDRLYDPPPQIDASTSPIEAAIEAVSKLSLTLLDPRSYRLVVGPGGSTINNLRKKTGTKIQVPRDQLENEAIEIAGTKEGCEQARQMILDIVSKGGDSGRK